MQRAAPLRRGTCRFGLGRGAAPGDVAGAVAAVVDPLAEFAWVPDEDEDLDVGALVDRVGVDPLDQERTIHPTGHRRPRMVAPRSLLGRRGAAPRGVTPSLPKALSQKVLPGCPRLYTHRGGFWGASKCESAMMPRPTRRPGHRPGGRIGLEATLSMLPSATAQAHDATPLAFGVRAGPLNVPARERRHR